MKFIKIFRRSQESKANLICYRSTLRKRIYYISNSICKRLRQELLIILLINLNCDLNFKNHAEKKKLVCIVLKNQSTVEIILGTVCQNNILQLPVPWKNLIKNSFIYSDVKLNNHFRPRVKMNVSILSFEKYVKYVLLEARFYNIP